MIWSLFAAKGFGRSSRSSYAINERVLEKKTFSWPTCLLILKKKKKRKTKNKNKKPVCHVHGNPILYYVHRCSSCSISTVPVHPRSGQLASSIFDDIIGSKIICGIINSVSCASTYCRCVKWKLDFQLPSDKYYYTRITWQYHVVWYRILIISVFFLILRLIKFWILIIKVWKLNTNVLWVFFIVIWINRKSIGTIFLIRVRLSNCWRYTYIFGKRRPDRKICQYHRFKI